MSLADARGRWVWVVVVTAAVAGCSSGSPASSAPPGPDKASASASGASYPGPPAPVTPPCVDSPAASAELGSPSPTEPAWFRTDGSTLYLHARRFEHGGVLDPAVGQTAIYIGPASIRPLAQPNGYVRGATHSLSLRERTYGAVTLPPGDYWLTSSQGGDLLVIGCSERAVVRREAP